MNSQKDFSYLNCVLHQPTIESHTEELGYEIVAELFRKMTDSADEIIVELKTAFDEDNKDLFESKTHKLRGLCVNYGLKQLLRKTIEIEERCKNNQTLSDLPKDTVDDLNTMMESTKSAISLIFSYH